MLPEEGSCCQCLTSLTSKERARLVPAAAVKPALQVVGTITGLKESVAGLASPW